jgi:hypothetical protein
VACLPCGFGSNQGRCNGMGDSFIHAASLQRIDDQHVGCGKRQMHHGKPCKNRRRAMTVLRHRSS